MMGFPNVALSDDFSWDPSAPQVRALVWMDPPRVVMQISNLDPATTSITIDRKAGGEVWPVRGAADAVVGSTAYVTDYEVPVGIPATYILTLFDADGGELRSFVFTPPTVPDPPYSSVWLSDPLNQRSPMLAFALLETDAERISEVQASYATPAGSPYSIASVTGRTKLQEWPLKLWVQTNGEAALLRDLLHTASPLCIRLPSWAEGLPPIIYGQVRAVERPRLRDDQNMFFWDLMVRAGRGTRLPVAVHRWTFGDLTALNQTYAETAATFPTFADLTRGP